MEFEESMINAASIAAFQVVQAEMEIQMPLASNKRIGNGLFLHGGFLLLQAMEDEFLRHN